MPGVGDPERRTPDPGFVVCLTGIARGRMIRARSVHLFGVYGAFADGSDDDR